MQPYFLPYIGYFQLIAAVDHFIIYDNIKYTKKGWINRNRLLQNEQDVLFSLQLKKDSDFLDIRERQLAADFRREKLLNQFKEAYRRAPYFEQCFPLLERIVDFEDANLFHYLNHSIVLICRHLGLTTRMQISSEIDIDHGLKGQEKVLALCKAANASTYINTIGGNALYSKDQFRRSGIELNFIRTKWVEYPQFGSGFVPWLSIIDVLMFNSLDWIREHALTSYELI